MALFTVVLDFPRSLASCAWDGGFGESESLVTIFYWQHRSRCGLVRHPCALEDLYLRWGSCVVARPPVDWYHGHRPLADQYSQMVSKGSVRRIQLPLELSEVYAWRSLQSTEDTAPQGVLPCILPRCGECTTG